MIKSELFQQSYCIFVSEIPDKVLQKVLDYGSPAIKILKASFKNKLYCIVIPGHYPFKTYEIELFNIYKNELVESGFWGQYAMGYQGKEWEIVV